MIRVDDLRFTYARGTRPAVRHATFDVVEGEIFGFLGPSGAGKSTIQKILTGLLHPYEGSARVLGRDVHAWGSDLFEFVGVGFEAPNHYGKMTGLENLAYFRSLYSGATRDPIDLLRQVGLADAARVPVARYSKGMQMRLSFARALIHHPKLLFLDEPTSGLDPGNARLVTDLILEHRDAGATVVLTTHAMTIADELCDRVAFITDGEIALLDTPVALRERFGKRAVRVETHDGEVHEYPLEGLADAPAFTTALRDGRVRSLHTMEATLERIFLEVTGKALS
ncbi:MAG: ABC transporter ATP-binding protein [Trueperaceae bacterium]|nr:ABC transporter ATP-binding protein [Trueperaceae bacterium]